MKENTKMLKPNKAFNQKCQKQFFFGIIVTISIKKHNYCYKFYES